MLKKPLIEEEEVVETEEALEEEEPVTELADDTIQHPEEVEGDEEEQIVHPEDMEMEVNSREQEESELEEEEVEQEQPSETSVVIDALKEELAALRRELAESRTASEGADSGEAATDGPTVEPISGIAFVGEEEDVTDLTMSAQGMNEFGARILNAAVQAAVTHAFELAKTESSKAVSTYAYSKEFYDRYPDLRKHGDKVQEVSEEIQLENPEITPQELFIESAKRAYKEIGKKMPTSKKRRAPGFTNATSAQAPRTNVRKRKTEQDDVLELLKHKGNRI